MSKLEDLRESRIFRGKYRGINFKISHHGISDYAPNGIWCGYIFLNDKELSEEDFNANWLEPQESEYGNRVSYEYYKCPLGNLDWHGGCTFYEKKVTPDTGDRNLQFGCDYNHLYDEGMSYTESRVHCDLKAIIDELHGLYKVKLWNPMDGSYNYEEVENVNPE